MYDFLESFIYFFIYFGIFLGVWLILCPVFFYFHNRIKVSRRFRLVKLDNNKKIKNRFVEHIEMLLSITYNFNSSYYLIFFFLISTFLFCVSFIVFLNSGKHILINILLSILIGLLPYLTLKIRLYNIRVLSSYEAEGLITELISQYKINHFNMIEAIDKTIPKISEQPYSQKALFKLSIAIKQYQDEKDLENIINEFNYNINTSWSFLLANNLFLSIGQGDDVYEALEDILDELKDLKRIFEKNKQYNNETLIMIKYVTPLIYLLSVYTMFAIFGFDIDKFINYQFNDPIGLKFFVLIISFIGLNYFIYIFLKRQKNDF